jgi:hypothetical protein
MKSGALAKVAFVLGGCVLLLNYQRRQLERQSYGVDVKSRWTHPSCRAMTSISSPTEAGWPTTIPDRASWGAGAGAGAVHDPA